MSRKRKRDEKNSKHHGVKRKRQFKGKNLPVKKYCKPPAPCSNDYDLSCVNVGLDSSSSLQNSVLRYCKLNSHVGKEMLAVMAALTETIDSQSGTESVTAYYAALMTFLESVQGNKAEMSDKEEVLSACVVLIGIFIRRLPEAVLKSEFSNTSKMFMKILKEFGDSENTMILKCTVRCLTDSLSAQEVAIWQNHSTSDLFQTILHLAIDSRPKIRKAAQIAVSALIKNTATGNSSSKHHPAVDVVVQFCMNGLNGYRGSKDSNTLLFVLGILKSVLVYFPQQYVKSVCESILTVMSFGDVVMKIRSLQTLHAMFFNHPKSQNVPASLTGKLITALYDYEPIENTDLWMNWLALLHEAFKHLHSVDEDLCFQHLPFLIEKIVKMWTSDFQQLNTNIADCLKDILYHMVQPLGERLTSSCPITTSVRTMFMKIENALTFQSHSAWNSILHVLAAFYEVAGQYCFSFMEESVRKLADLCENDEFTYIKEATSAIGMAVKTMGPREILKIIPLEFDERIINFKHSWLIPVLRDNICGTELAYFFQFILPFANELKKKGVAAIAAGNDSVGESFSQLELQLWSLLPGFCTKPTDLVTETEVFKPLAQLLGSILKTRPDLQLCVLSALRLLITKGNGDDKKEMSRYAKNYLPIMYNLYITPLTESNTLGIKMAVLETVKVYLTVTTPTICEFWFNKAISTWENEKSSEYLRRSVMDLICTVLPHLNADRLKETYKMVAKFTKSKDPILQKKSFRLLEELCSGRSDSSRNFVVESLNELQTLLSTSLSKSPPSTKALKLRCLHHLFNHISAEHKDFVKSLLPEVVMCVREPSTKARSTALGLLEDIGQYFCKITHGSPPLREYLQLLTIGLASSPEMIAATVMAISHVLQQFADHVLNDVKPLVENICILLQSSNRGVVGVALGFFKSLLAAFDVNILTDLVENIVACLVAISRNKQQPCRVKTREVFSRLVHKFGLERISHLVPEKLHKMLNNIVKEQMREKRKRSLKRSDDKEPINIGDALLGSHEDKFNSSDDDDEKDLESKYRKMQIRERAESSINFLEPSAFQNISAAKLTYSKDGRLKDKVKNGGFAISSDGKLLIMGEDEREKNFREDTSDEDESAPVKREVKQKEFSKKKEKGFSKKKQMKFSKQKLKLHIKKELNEFSKTKQEKFNKKKQTGFSKKNSNKTVRGNVPFKLRS